MCDLQEGKSRRHIPTVSCGELLDYCHGPLTHQWGMRWHFDNTNHLILNLFCSLREVKKSSTSVTRENTATKIKGGTNIFAACWVVQKLLVGFLVQDTSCLLKLLGYMVCVHSFCSNNPHPCHDTPFWQSANASWPSPEELENKEEKRLCISLNVYGCFSLSSFHFSSINYAYKMRLFD